MSKKEEEFKIRVFVGEYEFLSNFYPSKMRVWGMVVPDVEHAFQAMKCLWASDRKRILNCTTPGQAKRMGKQIELRPDWESVKDSIMYQCVLAKFHQNRVLLSKLLKTSGWLLEEGNNRGDTEWGIVDGKGENKLGRILMTVRDELRRGFFI